MRVKHIFKIINGSTLKYLWPSLQLIDKNLNAKKKNILNAENTKIAILKLCWKCISRLKIKRNEYKASNFKKVFVRHV